MNSESRADPFIILIAPNLSEQMGGEAIKSLQIYQELERQGLRIHQITHARVRDEMERSGKLRHVTYIEDDWIQRLLWKTRAFRMLVGTRFMWKAAQAARALIRDHPDAVVHFNSPVSPVIPLPRIDEAPVVVGPINGNIHHPPAFVARESLADRLRRILLVPTQRFNRVFFPGKTRANVLLVAGGERTRESLRIGGCREEQFEDTLDSGIPTRLRDRPIIHHSGRNLHFVQNGRLVPHKATDLIIRSMARTKNPVELDVIGRGPHKPALERLTAELGLADRVHFIEWFEEHSQLDLALRRCRAFVFPSLAEANGIVVQEAMMMGLPVICVDWGGPSLLVTPESGILIPPTSEEDVIAGLAAAMDLLCEDGVLADRMGQAAASLARSRGFAWDDLIQHWIGVYRAVAAAKSPGLAASPVAGHS